MNFQDGNGFSASAGFLDNVFSSNSSFNSLFDDNFKKKFSNNALLNAADSSIQAILVPELSVERKYFDTGTVDTLVSEQSSFTNSNIVPNQVDIFKFLNPNHSNNNNDVKKVVNVAVVSSNMNAKIPIASPAFTKKEGILESAFTDIVESEMLAISEEILADNPYIRPIDGFHSSEDIKKIHQHSADNCSEAFHKVTQSEISSNISANDGLELEFSLIQNNEHIDVFIEEFSQLISRLSVQKPVFENNYQNTDHFIEFKLSIHLIKVLSQMMQATHLDQFSDTVIVFLDDIIDGTSVITADIIERLSLVVDYYNYYNDSISKKNGFKF